MRSSKALQQGKLVAAVDIGGSKASCLIARAGESPDGYPEIEVVGAGQHGLQLRAAGNDVTAAAEAAVRGAVEAAERMAGEHVHRVGVAVAGRHLFTRRIGVDMDVEGGAITRDDVADCLAQGSKAAARDGARALHALPIRFAVDGEEAGANPCGLLGRTLSVEMIGLSVRDAHEANLRAVMERCNLEVDALFAAPAASAEAVLIDDEKELGVLLIDIGAKSADFAVFEDGAMTACGGVGLGGERITRDIAQIFGGSIAHAERAKTLYGAALAGAGDDHRFVDFPQLPDFDDITRVSRAELAAVIAPRLEEILTHVLETASGAIGRRGRASGGLRRAVLTGGASLTTGAREVAERVLGVRTRLGRPAATAGAPDAATAPHFAVAMGGLFQLSRPDYFSLPPSVHGMYGYDAAHHPNAGLFRNITRWLRANF